MKEHLIEIDGHKLYYISSELNHIMEFLKKEEKCLGIIYSENEIRIVEIEDYFDIRYERFLTNNLTIIIDSNLFIAARSIYKYGNINTPERKFFTSLLIYSKFLYAKFDPTICMYEFGNKPNHKAVNDLYTFRVVDNLSLETMLNLIFGKTHQISKIDWNDAKNKTREMNESEINEDYNKTLTRFKQNYPYVLKASIILRIKGISRYHKIKYFFDWILDDFITKADAITIAMYILSRNGGRIIKKFNQNNYSSLIKEIRNATWDVTYISYLRDQAKKIPDRYFLLVTNDKNLINAGKYFFTPDETIIDKLFGKEANNVRNIIEKINKICSLPGRGNLTKERLSNIDKTIVGLENELKASLTGNYFPE